MVELNPNFLLREPFKSQLKMILLGSGSEYQAIDNPRPLKKEFLNHLMSLVSYVEKSIGNIGYLHLTPLPPQSSQHCSNKVHR